MINYFTDKLADLINDFIINCLIDWLPNGLIYGLVDWLNNWLIDWLVCVGVLPCLPYSQQTKMKRRGNISLKLVAEMCVKAGFTHIITVDLHSKESQGFFSCRMDNLRASPFFMQYIVESIPDYNNAVIVAKVGSFRASYYHCYMALYQLLTRE